MLDRTDNPRAVIGGNNPPLQIDHAKEAMAELSKFTEDTPVIQTHDDAKMAGAFIERTRVALKTMEDERIALVSPLNVKLEAINRPYRTVRQPLERLYDLVRGRLTSYTRAEEQKRAAEAKRLREEAERLAELAREAEAHEQDVIACADVGECADVGGAIAATDAAIGAEAKAERAAAIAEKNTPVRIHSVMGNRAISMRNKRVLVIANVAAACEALRTMGLTDNVRAALIKDAKAFEDAVGELPDGITETIERSL